MSTDTPTTVVSTVPDTLLPVVNQPASSAAQLTVPASIAVEATPDVAESPAPSTPPNTEPTTPDSPPVTSVSAPPSDVAEKHVLNLDEVQRLDPMSFPNPPREGTSSPPATIPNTKHLLTSYGIHVKSNVITKRLQITMPGQSATLDRGDSTAVTQIISLATFNAISTGQIWSYIEAIADNTPYNPVAEWIDSKAWDGVDRLPAIYQTLVTDDDFPESLKQTLVRKWLLSAVAAAFMPSGFSSRGVLTFQGGQGIGKTNWLKSLVPDAALRQKLVKIDHHLDPNNKDSILGAIVHWLVEIGELDSSFKRDIGRMKGFITSDSDKVRRPYGRTESEYPRKTVFYATVNDHNFLVDSTGNNRFWTIPLKRIDYQHDIDMQQLFAQLAVQFNEGDQWWLTGSEDAELAATNTEHQTQSVVRDLVMEALTLERKVNSGDLLMNPTILLQIAKIERPTNAQCKECGSILREFFGAPKKINGAYKWRVPLKDCYQHLAKAKINVPPVEDEY